MKIARDGKLSGKIKSDTRPHGRAESHLTNQSPKAIRSRLVRHLVKVAIAFPQLERSSAGTISQLGLIP
jgi:hypothetical protein